MDRVEQFSLVFIQQLWAQHTTTAEKDHAQEFFQDTLDHIVYEQGDYSVLKDGLWISRLLLLIYT